MRFYVAGIALSLLPLFTQAGAQAAPPAGTWGAEGAIGGAGGTSTLLRMRDDRSALLVGFGFDVVQQGNTSITTVMTRVGLRRYAAPAQAVRPFHSFGVLLNIVGGDVRILDAGGFGELGASYFFNRHVSVGAAGEARLTFGRFGSAPNEQSTVRFNVAGPRIIATLFF